MNNLFKITKSLKNNSNGGFILLGSTIALFIILSVFSIFLIRVVVKENQISSYNIADIRTRNLSQSGLDHGIQLFKTANSPYLAPTTNNFNNGQYTITFDPSNSENGNPLPYSHFAMIKSSASINDAIRNTRLFVSSYPDAFNLAFFGNRTGVQIDALSFNGSNNYLSLNSLAIDGLLTNNMAFTFTFWFLADGTIENNKHNSIIFSIHSSNGGNILRIGLDRRANNGKIFYSDQSTGDVSIGSGNWNDQSWHQIAITRSPGSGGQLLTAYIDGGVIGSVSNANPDFNSATLASIAMEYDDTTPTDHWAGKIDEAVIWNYKLTQQEIQSYMNTPPEGNESGLVGYWNFNESSGNTAYDQTENGHNASINSATWVNITDSNIGSFSQSGGTINGDIYYNGNISGANLNGTAYTSTGSGGIQHPSPLPDFPIANTTYFNSILSSISPISETVVEENDETVLGKIVTVNNDGRVYASVNPHPWINYKPSGAYYWWQIRVEFQKVDGTNHYWNKAYGENSNNGNKYFSWGTWSGYSQILIKNIYIRGDFSHSYEKLRNVTIGGHNFGSMSGYGDNGTYHLEYSSGGGSESNCSGCITKSHGENKKNQTRSWSYNLGNSFSTGNKVNIRNIWVRGDLDNGNEYLNNVTIGGFNFGRMDGNCDCGTWYKGWSGTKTVNKSGTTVNASAFISNDVHYTPGGTGNWWAIKVEFAPTEIESGSLEITNSFNLNNSYPNGLLHGEDLSLNGINITGSGKIFATGDITITNCNIDGGIEIASSKSITINNNASKSLGSNVNSISNSIVIYAKNGVSISGGKVRGLIINEGTNLNISEATINGAVYTTSTTTNISGSTVTGSVVSKYGVNLSNSTINKGALPPTYDVSYGFGNMIIPGSYKEY